MTDPRLKRAGVSGFNKPKRTPNHPKKSHVVVAKREIRLRLFALVNRVLLAIGNLQHVKHHSRHVTQRTLQKERCLQPTGLIKLSGK